MFLEYHKNNADEWLSQLQIGLTKNEVIKLIGRPPEHIKYFTNREIQNFKDLPPVPLPSGVNADDSRYELGLFMRHTFLRWHHKSTPIDLPKKLTNGFEVLEYSFYVPPDVHYPVPLFFDSNGKLIGWVTSPSEWSSERYRHETLTSRLKEKMTPDEVVKILGEPTSRNYVVHLDNTFTNRWSLYLDHYWSNDPEIKYNKQTVGPFWVYAYSLPDEQVRHVYLQFITPYDQKVKLYNWGYDNASLEASRFISENPSYK